MQINSVSGGGVSAQIFQVGVQTTRSTDLQVVTAEGDRVTISADSIRMLGYASASGQSGSASVAGAAMQVSNSDSVSLAVEGDLSRDELQDLQKMVKLFQQAATRGDATKLLDRLSKSGMDSIASVAGTVSVETVVMVSETSASTSAAQADAPAEPPPGPSDGERAGERTEGFRSADQLSGAHASRHGHRAHHAHSHHREQHDARRDQSAPNPDTPVTSGVTVDPGSSMGSSQAS
jgi:hypothetical protein